MDIALFGATGPSGQLVLRRALAAGHQVTAYVRNPAKLAASGPGLTVVQGELPNAAAINSAIAGKQAVISLLGPSGKSTGSPVTDGMRNIVAAMQANGVNRLVATATPSATDDNDQFALAFWLATRAVKALAGSSYDDIVGMAALVRASKLDWTLLRLPMLTHKPAAAPVAAGYVGDPKIRLFSLSRDALAEFVVAQLADAKWSRKAPALSNGR